MCSLRPPAAFVYPCQVQLQNVPALIAEKVPLKPGAVAAPGFYYTTEFESYVKLNKKLPPEVVGVVQQIEDYAKLADTIAAHLALKIPDRQEMTRRYQPIAKNYFFLAPARVMLLIASGARPDFSAISRSCSIMKPRAGLSFSRPPSNSAGTRRLERCEPSS
jgi:hypothetical protein